MESLVSADHKHDHYHDASQHGLAWAALNELLHVIVSLYTLLGMIQFRIKFIRMVKLVKWSSRLLIAHSFYLSIKYGLLAILMYLYKRKLEKRKLLELSSNCAFAASFRLVMSQPARNSSSGAAELGSLMELPQFIYNYDHLALLAHLLHHYGGPFKLLGERMTLVYGFWAVALYIMLAIFPLELMYFVDVGYNFIRFVLSDPGCMADFYEKRREHLRRLALWSRNQASSMLTEGAKMTLIQRDLRSNYTQDSGQLAAYWMARCAARQPDSGERAGSQEPAPEEARARRQKASMAARVAAGPASESSGRLHDKHYRLSKMASVERKLSSNIHQLRSRLAINHQEGPSYAVRIANKNLALFKPFVRSHVWFKASMVIYPIYIFFYFVSLCFVLSSIHYYLELSLLKVASDCEPDGPASGAATSSARAGPSSRQLAADWSLWDRLTYYENFYIVFLLSCASSFYCSYYFGTILELSIWTKEICQQLELCAHVNELNYVLTHPSQFHSAQLERGSRRALANRWARTGCGCARSLSSLDHLVNQFGGFNKLWPETCEHLERLWWRLRRFVANLARLRFGALLGARRPGQSCCRPGRHGARGRAKLRELMAIKLLDKKETLMRATYLNMCLFFDELDETRFMTTTILRRTIQITCGYAFLASVTHSAFGPHSWHYTYLLLITFTVFNLYLACAAHINGGVKKMLFQVHSLISASLKSDGQDADLFEFWLRHVDSFGEDEDLKAYNIYGYAVTWSNLVNIDSIIFGAYFFNE